MGDQEGAHEKGHHVEPPIPDPGIHAATLEDIYRTLTDKLFRELIQNPYRQAVFCVGERP